MRKLPEPRPEDPVGISVKRFFDFASNATPTTDKVTRHSYELLYGLFLLPLQQAARPPKLLEIGLGCDMQYGPGASAMLWRRLLPNASIWEAERHLACVEAHRATLARFNINVLVGDQSKPAVLQEWLRHTGGAFDVIIDDGSHKNADILRAFEFLWPHVLSGGVYIMEDLHVGRHRVFDNTNASAVVSDVLQAWQEQLVVSSHIPYELQQRNGGSAQANVQARARARAHPLPRGLSFVFCQRQACVLGKERISIPKWPLSDGGQPRTIITPTDLYRDSRSPAAAQPRSHQATKPRTHAPTLPRSHVATQSHSHAITHAT